MKTNGQYSEAIRINVGLLPDSIPGLLPELERAGLYDIETFEAVSAVVGSIASKEWMDNINSVAGVKYVEEQAERHLA